MTWKSGTTRGISFWNGMGSNNSMLIDSGRKNSSNNNNSYESSRLFSSTSDNFSHDSYMDNRFCNAASTSTKTLSATNLLNWLPKKSILSVKQRLTKRFSAENSPSSYKFQIETLMHDDPSSAFRFGPYRGEDCAASLMDMSRPVKHTRKRSKVWYREHCKIFREFLSTWTLRDLHCLVVEFEAAKALSRLKWLADAARQPAPTVVDDLLRALRDGIAADTFLESARSPFFRNLIEKRCVASRKLPKNSHGRSKSRDFSEDDEIVNIVLDESVIPRQYAPVILHAMYADEVDLSLVIRGCVSNTSCLTEVQAIASGKCQVSHVNEATDIYQIAKFLEFDKLVEGCEDIIISYITIETLPSIYSWSNESYGSKFVRRCCVNFLCSEFVKVSSNVTLFDLEESILVEALRSDFLQASELEILNTIIRWGEHQLVKKIEEREPNILMGTTHSISRKGVRRSDLPDIELREVLSELSSLIRTDFMLPVSHPMFLNALQRNLITQPCPPIKQPLTRTHSAPYGHAYGCCQTMPMVPVDSNVQNVARPRLFRPYYETARQLLEQRLTEQPEQLNALINLHPPLSSTSKCLSIPQPPPYRTRSSLSKMNDCSYDDGWNIHENQKSQTSIDDQDFSGFNQGLLEQMILQVHELWQSKDVKRALACGCVFHRQLIVEQTCLKVAREHGLSDTVVTMLESWYLNFVDEILAVGHSSSSFTIFGINSAAATTSDQISSSKSNQNLLRLKLTSLSSNIKTADQNDDVSLFDEIDDSAHCSSKMLLERKKSNSEPQLNKAANDLPDLMTSLNIDNRSTSLRHNEQTISYASEIRLAQNSAVWRSSIASIDQIGKSYPHTTEQDEADELDQSFLSNVAEKQEHEFL